MADAWMQRVELFTSTGAREDAEEAIEFFKMSGREVHVEVDNDLVEISIGVVVLTATLDHSEFVETMLWVRDGDHVTPNGRAEELWSYLERIGVSGQEELSEAIWTAVYALIHYCYAAAQGAMVTLNPPIPSPPCAPSTAARPKPIHPPTNPIQERI